MVGVRAKGRAGGLLLVTLRTQGTIIPSDESIRSAGKAGIRPAWKAGARVSSLGREEEAGKAEASKTGKAEAGKKAGARRLGWVACLTLEAWLRGGEGRENVCKGVGGQGRHAVRGEKNLRGRENATGTPILGLPPVPTSVRAFFISAVCVFRGGPHDFTHGSMVGIVPPMEPAIKITGRGRGQEGGVRGGRGHGACRHSC